MRIPFFIAFRSALRVAAKSERIVNGVASSAG